MSHSDFPKGIALVIGGSGGIGASICEALAQAGGDVVLTYNSNKIRADEVVKKLKALGKIAESHQLSIGDSKRAKSLIDEIVSHFRIHTIVIAAGSDIEQLTLGGRKKWRTLSFILHPIKTLTLPGNSPPLMVVTVYNEFISQELMTSPDHLKADLLNWHQVCLDKR